MNRFILGTATFLLSSLALSASPASAQAARNYDCTKAGNANKAACKAAAAQPASKPAPAARNYDCSKAGNANKAVCKGSTTAPAPSAATATRNYDCSKAGNANKAVCKGAAVAPTPSIAAPRAAPANAARPAPATRTATGQNTNPGGPNGATAKCKDGTFSTSAHRSGTCSRHGGVAQWF